MSDKPEPSGVISLPGRAKPSKVASTDRTRPILQHAHVYQRNGHREIALTDSYCLVSLPVDDAVPVGPVNIEALKRIEVGEPHTVTSKGVEIVSKKTRQTVVYPTPDLGEPLDFKAILEREAKDGETVVTIGLNPTLLKGIADALGVGNNGVTIEVRVKDGTTLRSMSVRPINGRGKGEGVLMPMRCDG